MKDGTHSKLSGCNKPNCIAEWPQSALSFSLLSASVAVCGVG